MKKRYLYIAGAKRWNNLLGKFTKLQKRLQLLSNNSDSTRYKKLVKKLQNIFSKLEKMQYQTGIKVAGTSLALVLSTFTANAQFAAGAQLKYNGEVLSPSLSSSTFVDIDGDGDQDLYIGKSNGRVESFTNNNGVYTSNGTISINSGATLSVGTNASPTFADIDGDGDLDLYVGDKLGKILVLINTNGVFSNGNYLQAGGTEIDLGVNSSPEFADIDGDGDLDLYIGNGGGLIRIYTNNGGAFTLTGDLVLTGTNTISSYVGVNAVPAFADIDNDGDLDLYVGGFDGTVTLFTNNGGAFTYANSLQADGLNIDIGKLSSPTFVDIDNDNDLDLILNGNNSKIQIYTNNAGVFNADGNLEANDMTIDVGEKSAPTFADIDGDGDEDLYLGSNTDTGNDSEIKVYTNNSGVFTAVNVLPINNVGISLAPTFADIDSDGDLDLYVGEYYGVIKTWDNNGGNFTANLDMQGDGSPITLPYYSVPAFADIDNDGDLDLYVGHYGAVDVFTNNNGVFTSVGLLQANNTDIDVNYFAAPTFADIDSDGDLDLYLGSHGGNVLVYTNTNGVFGAGVSLQANGTNIYVGSPSKPSFTDIDNDGDLDLFVGNGQGIVMFYENTAATGVLVSSITVQGQGGVSTIATPAGTLQIEAAILPVNASNSTYTWSVVNGTGSATIDANGLLTAATDGTVTVTATANDASGETASMVVTISNQSIGVDAATANAINIYPNPVQNELFIDIKSEQVTEINILDVSGKSVKSLNNNTKTIDVSDLTEGIYLLKVRTENGSSTTKFIKK